jgi:hypothetical protein
MQVKSKRLVKESTFFLFGNPILSPTAFLWGSHSVSNIVSRIHGKKRQQSGRDVK